MEQVIVVQKQTGPIACLLGPRPDDSPQSCRGCQAYCKDDVQLCWEVGVDCTHNGGEVLAAIQVYVGTRFTGETLNGRIIEDAIVVGIVEWRLYPLQVHWTDSTGKHIEQFALHEFKKFKFL